MKVETIPLIELLKEEKGSILIASHESPDADTLGSALALYLFLKRRAKGSVWVVKTGCPIFLTSFPTWKR